MNYFELFEIPIQLSVDQTALSKKYLELSKLFHPDYFISKSTTQQSEALEKSAQLNAALRIFKTRETTIKYVLQLKGILEEEEKYELPTSFLMEVLEINEQLMDGVDETELPNIRLNIETLQKNIYEPVQKIIENYSEAAITQKELLQLKDFYFKKKYLHRIEQQLTGLV
ncbi:MAG: Fe-S protein assembly co-chaperone HscB [Chitinophagaceae bacterium]|nr:MAG: Fe-S protein assembly co-chaperone HscB [Chitinophagaceae bacterium]